MVKIRPISKADLPACARILAAAYCRPPYRERLTLNFARRYLAGKYRSGRRQSFVALGPDKKVIGFQFVTLSAWSSGPQAIMEELAVDPIPAVRSALAWRWRRSIARCCARSRPTTSRFCTSGSR